MINIMKFIPWYQRGTAIASMSINWVASESVWHRHGPAWRGVLIATVDETVGQTMRSKFGHPSLVLARPCLKDIA